MDPRTHRLIKEYENLVKLKNKSGGMFNLRVLNRIYTEYELEFYGIEGLYIDGKMIRKLRNHKAIMTLPAEFPLKMPHVKWITPIFHPNIAVGGDVCMGTEWTPMKSLRDIVIELADMIQFRSYNLDSPYNNIAKSWAQQHEMHLNDFINFVEFPPDEEDDLVIVDHDKNRSKRWLKSDNDLEIV